MHVPTSGLTVRGRCLLAAGLAAVLCSLILAERDLLRIALFLVALPLLSVLLAWRSRAQLRCERVITPPSVAAGDEVQVSLRVRRAGRFPPSGLLLEDEVPAHVGSNGRFTIGQLWRGSTTALHYSLRPPLRGVHEIGPVTVHAHDPFGLVEFGQRFAGRSSVTVLPRTEPLVGLPPGTGADEGDDTAARLRVGHGHDDATVRPYRYGDDLRKVHWRSTAHRDELMVRQEHRPHAGAATVLLDHRAAAHRGSGARSSMEGAVCLAASVALHLQRHGHPVQLTLADGRSPAAVPAYDSPDALLQVLARLAPSRRSRLECDGWADSTEQLIAVLGALDTTDVHQLCRYRRPGRAVLLDTPAWVGAAAAPEGNASTTAAERTLRAAGWVVITAGPDSTITDTWTRLCEARPAGIRLTGTPS